MEISSDYAYNLKEFIGLLNIKLQHSKLPFNHHMGLPHDFRVYLIIEKIFKFNGCIFP